MAGQFINAPSPSRREARNFENELDIVIVGNKSDKNVTSGQYVTVRDSAITGITNGIYKATANVAAGTAFVAANLSAVTSGALNDLNGNLTPISLTGLTTSGTGAVSLDIPYNNYYITTPKITNIADAYCITFNSNGNYAIRALSRVDNTPITNTSVNVQFLKLQTN